MRMEDVVIKATGWTMGRDTELGLQFSLPYFFGGAQLMVGLRDTWAREMIKTMGNMEEIYHRNLGDGSPYKLERGLNNLWSHGGVLCTPILD